MTASRILLAFGFSLALASTATAADGVGSGGGIISPFADLLAMANEGPYGVAARGNEGPYGKCLMHWTVACDAAFGIEGQSRSPISPSGEGLPLPWPFPWKVAPGGDGSGI